MTWAAGRSRVLWLRGLPFRAVDDDMKRFFAPLTVTRGESLAKPSGNRIFEAGGKDVGDSDEMPPSLAGTRQQQRSSLRPDQNLPFSFRTDGFTLKLRGLPFAASVEDILEFFEGFQLTPDHVHLETRTDMYGDHTGTGVAYVQFVSSEAAEQAQNTKHKQMMGTRYIECMILIPGRHMPTPFGTRPLVDGPSAPGPAALQRGPNQAGMPHDSSAAGHMPTGRGPPLSDSRQPSPGLQPTRADDDATAALGRATEGVVVPPPCSVTRWDEALPNGNGQWRAVAGALDAPRDGTARDSGNGGCSKRHGICISSRARLWLGCRTCFVIDFQWATPRCPCSFQHQLCRSQLTILHCLLVRSWAVLSCTVMCLC
ncbi:hypothetical protein WJX79_000077 [Trebouxia sp. C0005]